MARIPFRLLPVAGLSGSGPRWRAETSEPWFKLDCDAGLGGQWVRFKWRSGLADPVSRPVLRCRQEDGQHDILLPAAIFGQKEWFGYIPDGTTSILISPVGFEGAFGFVLDEVDILLPSTALLEAGRRSILATAHALGAALIGRHDDFRSLMAETLATHPLSAYPRLRRQEERVFDPLIDGAAVSGAARTVYLVIASGAAREPLEVPLLGSLRGQQGWHVRLLVPDNAVSHWQVYADDRLSIVSTDAGMDGWIEGLDEAVCVAVLPEGAQLAPNAMHAVHQALARDHNAMILYGDEGLLEATGDPVGVRLKPGFDPLLLGQMPHLGHASFWRVALLRQLLPVGATEPVRINHLYAAKISRVLVDLPKGTSPYGEIEQRFAAILAVPTPALGSRDASEVAIIIPTRDRLDLLRPCIESVLAHSTGPFRVVVLDNNSVMPRSLQYFDKLVGDDRFLVHPVPGPFNFSELCNIGSRLVESPILLFLNNDTTVLTPGWLDRIRPYTSEPGIGAVGMKLLYPSGKVQHAGVIGGLGGRAGHFEPGLAPNDAGFFGRSTLPHALSAVTGACLAVERRKFEDVGGFDATNLPVDLNDIDLCFRLDARGYQTVLLPDCLLCHHESASRGRPRDTNGKYARERRYFSVRWMAKLRADPHFNPALSLYTSQPRLG